MSIRFDRRGQTPACPILTTLAGRQFELRPIQPSDAEGYDELVASLTPSDKRYRFFSAFQTLPERIRDDLTNVDHESHEAFVAAQAGAAGSQEIRGVVRMIRNENAKDAEYAVITSQNVRGVGLGYALMQYVINYARYIGVKRLYGNVMMENTAMLQMCRELGFTQRRNPEDATMSMVSLML